MRGWPDGGRQRGVALFVLAASMAAVIAPSISGCGLVLDTDPPDPQPGALDGGALDGGVFDAGASDAGRGDAGTDGGPMCAEDVDCKDDVYCNGEEHCVEGACVAGTPPCEGVEPACARVHCSEDEERCVTELICADGEVCSADGVCIPAPDCVTDTDCPDPDGDRCNGWSRCASGTCVSVPAVACAMIGCLASRCDPSRGECEPPTPIDAACDDGVGCTIDTCGMTGECEHLPDTTVCADDGFDCSVTRCDAARGCVHDPIDFVCGDGLDCTLDRCMPRHTLADREGCVHVPDDSLCAADVLLGTCAVAVCSGLSTGAGGPLPGLPAGCSFRSDDTRCASSEICAIEGGERLPRCRPRAMCTRTEMCDDRDPCTGVEACVMGRCARVTPGCPNSGCLEGYCDTSVDPAACALRPTLACFSGVALP